MATDVLTTINFGSYIGGLPAANALAGTDVFYVIQSGVSKHATGTQIAALVPVGQPGQSNTAYFNVRNYGATGNGTTDDTVAIKSAIAALNTAGVGVLYFPGGTYLVSSPLTTITANCMIRGDGAAGPLTATGNYLPFAPCSLINYTSNSTSCFTVTNNWGKFCDIAIQYTGTAIPVSGSAGITVTSTNTSQKVDYDTVSLGGFYINLDSQTGEYWSAINVISFDFIKYGIKIANINNPDAGDWSLVSCAIVNTQHAGTTGIRVESSGGGKVTACKIHGRPNILSMCIDVVGGTTVDFNISNCSFESFVQAAINVVGTWPGFVITGCEFSAWSTSSLSAVSITSNPTSIISGCAFNGAAWAGTALINLTSSTGVVIGPCVVDSSITIPLHN